MSIRSFFFPEKPISFTTSFAVKALAANEEIEYSPENQLRHFRHFLPFFTFQIHNNSNATLSVIFDRRPDSIIRIAPQNQAARRNLPFSIFQIKNISTANATAANEVLIVVERVQ